MLHYHPASPTTLPDRPVDAPPPYTESSTSTSVHSPNLTPTSSTASLPSIRSASPIGLPLRQTYDIKHAQPPPPAPYEHHPTDHDETPEEPHHTLPPDVQRAKAPLQIHRSMASISGNFLVLQGEDRAAEVPDVSLRTSNSSIRSAVYVDGGEWGRPVVVEACTSNSSIALAVHTQRPRQAVDIRATTRNSSASVLLPGSFHGLLILSTTNSRKTLTPELQRVSVRVRRQDLPRGNAESSGTARFLEMLEGLGLGGEKDDGDEEWYEINGSGGPSRAVVSTKNSRVSAGFVGEEGEGKGSCRVM